MQNPDPRKVKRASRQPQFLSLCSVKLLRSKQGDHFRTVEAVALCLALEGETHSAQKLEAYFDIFTHHYL